MRDRNRPQRSELPPYAAASVAELVDGIATAVVVIDRAFRIRWSNRFLQTSIERGADEITGRYCFRMLCRRNDVCPDCPAAATFRTGEVSSTRHCGDSSSGAHGAVTTIPIRDAHGSVTHVFAQILDVGQPKPAAEEWSRQRGTPAGASHEKYVRELLLHQNLELETLNAIVTAVGSSLDLDEVLERALESVLRIDGIRPQGGIFLMDDDDCGLHLEVHRGLSSEFVAAEQRIRVGECLCGIAAVSREIITSDDSVRDVRHCRAIGGAGVHAHIIVPLVAHDRVQGVLFLYPELGRKLSADDRRLFTTIGGEIGIAIENARLYRQTDSELRVKVAELQSSLDEVQRQRSRAEASRRTKDDLIAMVSHDLTTPLSGIAALAEVIIRCARADGREADERRGEALRRNVRRMASMIADLVESARLESGELELRRAPVSLSDLAADVLDTLPAEERQRVAIATRCDLPPAFADRDRIGRALMNLVTNALKFSPPASPVSLEFAASDREVVGSVRDRGVGIERENLERVFERFYRVGAPRGPAGLGLGLYITKLLVEAHGGRIWAESATGEGSTFRFALPVAGCDQGDAR